MTTTAPTIPAWVRQTNAVLLQLETRMALLHAQKPEDQALFTLLLEELKKVRLSFMANAQVIYQGEGTPAEKDHALEEKF